MAVSNEFVRMNGTICLKRFAMDHEWITFRDPSVTIQAQLEMFHVIQNKIHAVLCATWCRMAEVPKYYYVL